LAHASQLQGLSITDHDTVAAYTDEVFAEAKRLSLLLLPGIELSSELHDKTVHVLGYGFDLCHPDLAPFLAEMQRRRRERNRAILEKLARRGIAIGEDELTAHAEKMGARNTIGRPHIAQLLVEKEIVSSSREAFDLYLREGASCYTAGFKYSPREVAEAIRSWGGKAVLAHPHFLPHGSFKRSVLQTPFDGIECYYGLLPKVQEMPWLELAKKKGWIATGGSDYHGALRPHIPLGCSWVGESVFHALYRRAH
jgi:predicted metal-dependent phosphoesterase TrpH